MADAAPDAPARLGGGRDHHPGGVTVVSDPAPAPRQAPDAVAGKLKRTEVQRSLVSVPGREIVQVLTEIPVGVESGWHTHPGEEVGYIAAGTVEVLVEGRPPRTLSAGEGFLIPPGTPHNARDLGPGTGQMLSTYLVEIGEPLVTLLG
jgi:quercetin dioxygenase-like cupin family protein